MPGVLGPFEPLSEQIAGHFAVLSLSDLFAFPANARVEFKDEEAGSDPLFLEEQTAYFVMPDCLELCNHNFLGFNSPESRCFLSFK